MTDGPFIARLRVAREPSVTRPCTMIVAPAIDRRALQELKAMGARPFLAHNVSAATDVLRSLTVDALLVDIDHARAAARALWIRVHETSPHAALIAMSHARAATTIAAEDGFELLVSHDWDDAVLDSLRSALIAHVPGQP